MCGICGEFYPEGSSRASSVKVKEMMHLLSHRGPDGEGIYVEDSKGLCLGHRRLKVIDLETGDQPMGNEDGSIIVSYNGEIYNFLELKEELVSKGHKFKTRSDTEVIVHLYEEEGIEFLRRVVGIFAFALFDSKSNRLFLVRDPIGVKPLFYAQKDQGIIFGSELQAVIRGLGEIPTLDKEAIFDYLLLQYVPNEKTIFEGIKKLLPGNYLVVDSNGIRKVCYWDLEDPEDLSLKAKTEIIELLKRSVKGQLISDVPLGLFLSGGIDSTTLVSLAREFKGEGLKTFSVDFSAIGGAEEVNETKWSNFVAEYYRTAHHRLRVSGEDAITALSYVVYYLDEPISDPACIPTYLISKLARKEVTVVLSGEGADELFGGYLRYRLGLLSRYFSIVPKRVWVKLDDWVIKRFSGTRRIRKALWALSLKDRASSHIGWSSVFRKEELERILAKRVDEYWFALERFFSGLMGNGNFSIEKTLRADLKTWLVDDLLVKLDRMSMAVSLEARVPYLDHRLVELILKIPPQDKVGIFSGKKVFKEAVRGLIPDEIIRRKKAGFTLPLDKWFRNELKEFLCTTLSKEKLKENEILSPDAVQDLIQAHLSFKDNFGQQLYSLLLLELWQDKIKRWLD